MRHKTIYRRPPRYNRILRPYDRMIASTWPGYIRMVNRTVRPRENKNGRVIRGK